MTAIPEEAKQEIGIYFEEGIHKVKISGTALECPADKEYLEVSIEGENGESTEVRLYLTEKAMKFSINTIRSIFVHNTEESKKELVRDAVNACKTTEELAILCQKLDGMECWYSKYKSGTTYTNASGEVKNSYNNNLFAYEPKPPKNNTQTVKSIVGGQEITSGEEYPF
jgi:hypothetical protein